MAIRNCIYTVLLAAIVSLGSFNANSHEPSEEEIIEKYHWIWHYDPDTWPKSTWFGISTLQNPNDLWIIQEIIYETKPDLIIETGTYHGGSAVVFAMLMQNINPGGKVVTVDIHPPKPEAVEHPLWEKYVTFLQGSSTDPEIVNKIKEMADGKSVFINFDSLHTREHVLQELKMYTPMLQVGNYVVVQDTNVHGHPVFPDWPPGPMEAVDEFMKDNDRFIIDPSRERLLHTMHPRGYLKRVKPD